MARPIKEGLDYFPIDVNMDSDDKIQLIEAEVPNSFGLIIKLLMRIYRNGYYLKWDDKSAKLFAKNNFIHIKEVNNLVNACLNEGLFNKAKFTQYGVLTSAGIQLRFFQCATRRKQVNAYRNLILVDINSISTNINLINDDNSTQSKVKKRKEKKSKEKLISDFEKFWDLYGKKVDRSRCEPKFAKLSDEIKEKIYEHVPRYVASTPNVQYRKNPETYLNQKAWNNQIIEQKSEWEIREEQEKAEIERKFQLGLI